jgi:hypothetical protein
MGKIMKQLRLLLGQVSKFFFVIACLSFASSKYLLPEYLKRTKKINHQIPFLKCLLLQRF